MLVERAEFQTHERMFNKQADVGGKMSGVKRHDQIPECEQDQSDCRDECPRMQASPGTGQGLLQLWGYAGVCWIMLGTLCVLCCGREEAALQDCGGGIWLTLTGSISEGEGRQLGL